MPEQQRARSPARPAPRTSRKLIAYALVMAQSCSRGSPPARRPRRDRPARTTSCATAPGMVGADIGPVRRSYSRSTIGAGRSPSLPATSSRNGLAGQGHVPDALAAHSGQRIERLDQDAAHHRWLGAGGDQRGPAAARVARDDDPIGVDVSRQREAGIRVAPAQVGDGGALVLRHLGQIGQRGADQPAIAPGRGIGQPGGMPDQGDPPGGGETNRREGRQPSRSGGLRRRRRSSPVGRCDPASLAGRRRPGRRGRRPARSPAGPPAARPPCVAAASPRNAAPAAPATRSPNPAAQVRWRRWCWSPRRRS